MIINNANVRKLENIAAVLKADDIRVEIGQLSMDLDALDDGTYDGKYASNFEAADDDEIPEMIVRTKALIMEDIAALVAQEQKARA